MFPDTAYAGNDDGTDGRKLAGFLLGAGLLLGLLILFAVMVNAHAIERHGSDAVYVKECQASSGNLESWFNPDTQRSANIVCLPEGKFGLEICEEDGSMVTCFIKEKMKKLEQVYQYLQNRGYTPPENPIAPVVQP